MAEEKLEMEMEMELDGEELMEGMEEVISEKVKQEEAENKKNKGKRGPKAGDKKDGDKKEKAEPKKKELNLADINVIQREIKKGRLSAPHGRIEKLEDGDYSLKLSPGIIFTNDAKYEEVQKISKMNDGKYVLTQIASNNLGVEKFKAKHENGQEIEHDFVRVELHKPGRDKDVVELFTVRQANDFLKIQDAKAKKKEEDAKKKAEADKAKKEEESKKEEKETVETAK